MTGKSARRVRSIGAAEQIIAIVKGD